ncbi:MAG: hypothetical protein RIQ93_203 [Verrucomicrobiota bacterium]|jgi:uncharacterized membrane protein
MKRIALRWVVALFFIVAGANHFRSPDIYLGMIPEWMPWPAGLNAISGLAEIVGGLGLLLAPARKMAGWGLIALLIAIFPANIHVALQGHMPGTTFPPLVLWLRLPFQLVFIALVWWVAIARTHAPRSRPAVDAAP